MLHPQQNDIRNLFDLSGIWEFQPDPQGVGEREGWHNRLPAPRPIAVPASWNDQYGEQRDFLGAGWYVRVFFVPSGWQGQRIFLRFGSVNYAARVWLNGAPLGEHQGGHLPFEFEITRLVRWGAENHLALRVENELQPQRVPPGNVDQEGIGSLMSRHPLTAYDFFPYCGIHRPALLYAVPEVHIADLAVTTFLSGRDGLVQVVAQAEGARQGSLHLRTADGMLQAALTFHAGQAQAEIRVPAVRRWQPADPHLYPLTVTLEERGKTVDRCQLEIGVRTVAVAGDRLLLNGEPVFLRGFGRHEDFPIHGRGLDLAVLVKDYDLLRWCGANSYRTSHYPYAEEAMTLADRLGILVIDETPAVGLYFKGDPAGNAARLAQAQQQLAALIARDRNHPAVIAWSVANEPVPPALAGDFSEQAAAAVAAGAHTLRSLIEQAHALDPSRPALFAGMPGSPAEWLALGDIVAVNRYWGWYTQPGMLAEAASLLEQELDMLHEELGKPILVSEFGADTLAGMHADPPEMWSEEYQAEMLRGYLEVIERKPFVCGAHVWNLADFKTSQSTGRVGGMNLKGVFTRDRRPKLAAHLLRQRWAAKPAARAETTSPQTEAAAPAHDSQPEDRMQSLLEGVARRLDGKKSDLNTTLRFNLGAGQVYRLVIEQGRCRILPGDGEAAAEVRMKAADAEKLFTGRLNPMIAFTTGKIKVSGDLKAVMALRELA